MGWFCYRWRIGRPVPGNWYVIRYPVDDYNIRVACGKLVLEQDQAVGRTEHSDSRMSLCYPVTRDRTIAVVTKLRSKVGVHTARGADCVREQE